VCLAIRASRRLSWCMARSRTAPVGAGIDTRNPLMWLDRLGRMNNVRPLFDPDPDDWHRVLRKLVDVAQRQLAATGQAALTSQQAAQIVDSVYEAAKCWRKPLRGQLETQSAVDTISEILAYAARERVEFEVRTFRPAFRWPPLDPR
jgi:hypothetical protein